MSIKNLRWLCLFQSLRTPVLSNVFCCSIFLWWLYNNYIFYFVIFPQTDVLPQSLPIICLNGMFTFASLMCLLSFFRSIRSSPGVCSKDYRFILEEKERSYCDKCHIYRPRRTHHCRVCGVCIRQFDHHCLWIKNCVGEDNKWIFSLLIFYATALTVLMFCALIYYYYDRWGKSDDDEDDGWDDWNLEEEEKTYFNSLKQVPFILLQLQFVTGFSVCITQFFCQRTHMVRTGLTGFQVAINKDRLPKVKPTQSLFDSLSELFGTSNVLLWLLGPVRSYKPRVQLFYHNDEK